MVIFGTGVVTGGLLVRHADGVRSPDRPRGLMPFNRPVQPPSSGGSRLDFLRRMERELNLTTEQRERIDKILKESQEYTKKLMEPVSPQIRQELQKTKERFRDVLTPEQQARFDEVWRHQQQRPREQQRHPVAPRDRPLDNIPSNSAASTNLTTP